MSTPTLFEITFYLAAPFWALMILAPRWSLTRRVMSTPWVAALPLAVYTVLVIPEFATLWAAVSRPDLDVLRDFLATPVGAAAIWAHLISFDLFIGRWMYRDALERGIPHLVLAPILLLTIPLSPFGLLAYLTVRSLHRNAGKGANRRDSRPVSSPP